MIKNLPTLANFLIKSFISSLLASLLIFTSIYISQKPIRAIGNSIKINNSLDDVVFPQITSDNNGYLHVAWMEVTPNQNWSGNVQNPGIYYSKWNGDIWSTPLKISNNTLFAENPALAVDNSNTVHSVWDEKLSSDGSWKIHYKSRSSTGTWSSIETLPIAGTSTTNWSPKIATDNSDNPNVVFTANNTAGDSIYWTEKVSGAWSSPQLVSIDTSLNTITDSQWTDIRNDSSGNLHLLYWSWSKGVFYRKHNGTTWDNPILVTSASIQYPRISVTPEGQIFVVWLQDEDTSIRARWTQSGIWQTEQTLTILAANSFWGYPILGITTDSKERAHAGWGEKNENGLVDLKFKSFNPSNNTWGTAQNVDLDNNDADSPFVFPDKWDNQHFAWTEYNPSTTRWELYYRVAEGTISNITTAGGTLTANPFNTTYATLEIPANALTNTAQISIQIGPVPENVDPNQVTIPRAFTFRPHGLVFANGKIATASIFYTDAEVVGADERELKSWLWNSQTNSWEARSNRNTPSQNRIQIDLTGFSLYGISAPLVNINWLQPYTNEVVKQGALLFEFRMNYANGNVTRPPTTPDELKVELVNSSGSIVATSHFEPNGVILDKGYNVYKDNLLFQKSDIENGNYTLKVYLAGNLVGSQNFILER